MDFYKRVLIVCRQIPFGKVVTYGQVALLCGKPKNARQVGYALNKGCGDGMNAHRVVNREGYLSGAAAFGDSVAQKALLEEEGVFVTDDLKVDLKKYGWKNSLLDAEKLREKFEEVR